MKILQDAENYCASHGHRFTEPRSRVLAILGQTKAPLSAYDIIDRMPDGTKPPTVYRALEFWEQEGFVHKIDSMNAYAICHAEGGHEAGHCNHGPQFLICESCKSVTEIHACHLPSALEKQAIQAGFTPQAWSVEIRGLCTNCK